MRRNKGKSPKLDLKLNLSLRSTRAQGGPSNRPVADDDDDDDCKPERSSSSLSNSCVSSEDEQKQSSSPQAMSMVLAGCPKCHMYFMLSKEDPKCPKCNSSVLLDFQYHGNAAAAATTKTKKNRKS